MKIYLTRDRVAGELSDFVDVWAALPEREVYEDGDVQWNTNEGPLRNDQCCNDVICAARNPYRASTQTLYGVTVETDADAIVLEVTKC